MRDMLNFIWQSELRDRCLQSENMKLLLREVSLRSKRPCMDGNERTSTLKVYFKEQFIMAIISYIYFLFLSDLHLSFRSEHPNSESWPD
jgi:hypothetical protein